MSKRSVAYGQSLAGICASIVVMGAIPGQRLARATERLSARTVEKTTGLAGTYLSSKQTC